jgi:hypothetical protein
VQRATCQGCSARLGGGRHSNVEANYPQCDEQQPNCANCVKQGTSCEYRPAKSREPSTGSPMPLAALTPMPNEANVVDTPQPILPAKGPGLDPIEPNVTQLRLMHHYTTVTAKTLAHDAGSEAILTNNMVQTSFSYPFLLHAILAISALHLSRFETRASPAYAEYYLLADRHHDAALAEFRATVRDIDDTNWKAVLMFAGALFPYSCTASFSASDGLDLSFANFLNTLALTRRVRPMVAGIYQVRDTCTWQRYHGLTRRFFYLGDVTVGTSALDT